MAIQKLEEKSLNKNVLEEALKYIDKNGVPFRNQSTTYELVTDDGKRFPPKYVLAVADHLANAVDISTDSFNSVEAKSYLEAKGFTIETKQEEFELTITAESVVSTDKRFTMDNISLGDDYKPIDVYFQKGNGEVVRRSYNKGERRICNQTMPRIACQVFEKQLESLSVEEKERFPICKYNPQSDIISGIFTSIGEYQNQRNTIEFMVYDYDNGRQFVIYSWNIFSTILFVQECLKRFGEPGDKFVLTYCERAKGKNEDLEEEAIIQDEKLHGEYRNQDSSMLIESKNMIFRGAPGTGKSYLAKEIATDIISNGSITDYTLLTEEQKKQIEFVQFHPSYDYSDFVEGLRPKVNDDGTMGFELRDGIFKKFVARARKNYEDSQKSRKMVENEFSVQDAMEEFFTSIELGSDIFKTINGSEFTITNVDDSRINISIPGNAMVNKLSLNLDEVRKMLESGQEFDKIKDITTFFGKTFATQAYSYDFAIYKAIKARKIIVSKGKIKQTELKKYVFIIDEINRGEISKILGELFFSIDPGYRGKAGEISTQYSNMHSDTDEKFYIPDNVYIIGTMNDIDRSVDSFDFAMRRRFRFVELRADARLEMLELLENEELKEEAIRRMTALNNEIAAVDDLNENYQIGASYFLKLKILDFDHLWTDYLEPLLKEYVQGMYNEDEIMNRFVKAYGCQNSFIGDAHETTQDQG